MPRINQAPDILQFTERSDWDTVKEINHDRKNKSEKGVWRDFTSTVRGKMESDLFREDIQSYDESKPIRITGVFRDITER